VETIMVYAAKALPLSAAAQDVLRALRGRAPFGRSGAPSRRRMRAAGPPRGARSRWPVWPRASPRWRVPAGKRLKFRNAPRSTIAGLAHQMCQNL
jgi:hypothetical protein